jgi:hypothetical protein
MLDRDPAGLYGLAAHVTVHEFYTVLGFLRSKLICTILKRSTDETTVERTDGPNHGNAFAFIIIRYRYIDTSEF